MHTSPHWRRNAAFFIAGQFLSMFGSMLVGHSLTWHITLQEQSGSMIALFTCASMLPMVFISPFAGVWADRYNRKYLINIADAGIALVTLIVAVLYAFDMRSIWFLFVAAMARSAGQGVQQPAVNALIPQIVPEEHIARFNGIQSTAQSLTMFAAPMAAGALLSFLPIEYVFFIDVITAAIGIATVFFCVKVSGVPDIKERGAGIKAYYNEMAEGVRFIGSQAWLKTLFIFSAIFGVLVSPAAMLTPLQITRAFGEDVWRLSLIEITFSIGMMAGGVLITIWGGFKNKAHTMVLSWIVFGVTMVLFGIVGNFWVYLGIMIVCGVTMPLFNTPCMTIIQTKIPANIMGRVFSVMGMINGIALPLGTALFGPLGDLMRIEILFIITGSMIFAGGFALRSRREVMGAGIVQPSAV